MNQGDCVRAGLDSEPACHLQESATPEIASACDEFVVEDEYWKLIANQRC